MLRSLKIPSNPLILTGILGVLIISSIWAAGFANNFLWNDDGLGSEKGLLLAMWALHTIHWASKAKSYRISTVTLVVIGLAIALGILGLATQKASIVGFGFVLYAGGAILGLEHSDRRFPYLLMASLAILTLPQWLILKPTYQYLQQWATTVPAYGLSLIYDGVVTDGFLIFTPGTQINIAKSCDGASVLILSLSCVFWTAIGNPSNLQLMRRLIGTYLWAILLNWARIISIGVVGNLGDPEFAFGDFHDGIGHVTFFLCLAPLLWYSQLPDMWNLWIDKAIDWSKGKLNQGR